MALRQSLFIAAIKKCTPRSPANTILAAVALTLIPHTPSLARPPQAAFDACVNQQQGDSCSMNTPRGNMQGQCRNPPHGSQLVCVPEHHRRGQQASHRQGQGQGSGAGQRPTRQHRVTQSDGELTTQAANNSPITSSRVTIVEQAPWRIIEANGISEHATGDFPNRGNPNAIREQRYRYRVPLVPELNAQLTSMQGHSFGIAVNGVPFDPGAAEWYLGQRGPWQYEPLSGAIALGVDTNHAHVQPNGAYHYHGLPTGLMQQLSIKPTQHSALMGWAADGFPIYALYGYSNGSDSSSGHDFSIAQQTSSYRLKSGKRPSGGNNPGGHYDGTFINDYEYVEGQGTLDECNGRFTKTPEFPEGTYAYFLTQNWPVIPRCYKGTPSKDFTLERRR